MTTSVIDDSWKISGARNIYLKIFWDFEQKHLKNRDGNAPTNNELGHWLIQLKSIYS